MKFRDNLPEQGSGSKNFLKLKDRESVTGVFCGDIREFFGIWENSKMTEVPEGTPKAGFRFRVNFVVKEGSNYIPKIFENGVSVYRQLAELNEEYPLEETVVKITRNGTGTDTTYSILPMPPKMQMTKEAKEYLKKLELLPLESRESSSPSSFDSDEEIPF
jgi:hypothetical protein